MAEITPPDRSTDRIHPGKSLEFEKPVSQPPSTFESYMQGTANSARGSGSTPPGVQGPSPMQVTSPSSMQPGTPTFASLQAQARNVHDQLGTIADQLNTPNLKLKRSQNHLLKNKLQDANGYIRSGSAKLGIDTPPPEGGSTGSPVARFLSYIGNGQDQLMAVQQKLAQLAKTNGELRPGDMMFLQIKMGQAQQEIEYSSTLLSKVIDSLKTIINTQL